MASEWSPRAPGGGGKGLEDRAFPGLGLRSGPAQRGERARRTALEDRAEKLHLLLALAIEPDVTGGMKGGKL